MLQSHYPFPDSPRKLLAAYAYMLSHPGLPCVFWLHVYGKKNADGIMNGKEPDVTLCEEDGRIDLRGVWVPPNNPGFDWQKCWPDQEAWSVGSQVLPPSGTPSCVDSRRYSDGEMSVQCCSLAGRIFLVAMCECCPEHVSIWLYSTLCMEKRTLTASI